MEVNVNRPLLESNEAVAAELSETFRKAGVLVVNMISSPGAARTTLTKAASKRRSPIVMPAACASM